MPQLTAERLAKVLNVSESFDLIRRDVTVCSRPAAFFFVDGFIKDEIYEKILEFLYTIDDQTLLKDAETFSASCIPYCEVDVSDDEADISTKILSGVTALVIDGLDKVLLLDIRTYPQRETGEPSKDKVFRGSHDGFVETLILNTALIRRRIRTPRLHIEAFSVGALSKTDIAVCYIEGMAKPALLQKIRDKLKNTNVQALTMNQESLSEILFRHSYFNPFPKFKYTERPDTAAAQILEGDIVLLVDNSPAAMVLPASLFDVMEEANDYYFPPVTGTYLRLTRFLVTLITLILTPLWLLLVQNPGWVPEGMRFILLSEPPNVPVFWQLILLELAIDGLKLAALSTPNMLTTPLSVISGIVVGDFAVKSGWFSAETMLYMAFVAIANYNQPSWELTYAFKFMRLGLLVLTALFNFWGFLAGLTAIFLMLCLTRTFSGLPYLYPLIPLDLKRLKNMIFRIKIDS